MRKDDEVKKCLSTLKRLSAQMEILKSLNLGVFDFQYLQGSMFYLNNLKSNLNSILLGRAFDPEIDKEYDEKNEHKNERSLVR